MISMTEELLIKSTFDFIEKYRDDVSSDFTRQIVSLRDFFISRDGINDLKKMTIKDLSLFILNENLSSIFPDVFTATMIFITIPVTSAPAERSFSKLINKKLSSQHHVTE